MIAEEVRKYYGKTEKEMPLALVLEGGGFAVFFCHSY
jgi:hypothetical protein